jgi:heme/copper-type cytochrome/quinol oxidase subunit 1
VSAAFAGWNFVSSIGAYISGIALLVFLYVVFRTLTSHEHVADNYWGAGATTLEWSVPSPPPFHTFEELPRNWLTVGRSLAPDACDIRLGRPERRMGHGTEASRYG